MTTTDNLPPIGDVRWYAQHAYGTGRVLDVTDEMIANVTCPACPAFKSPRYAVCDECDRERVRSDEMRAVKRELRVLSDRLDALIETSDDTMTTSRLADAESACWKARESIRSAIHWNV